MSSLKNGLKEKAELFLASKKVTYEYSGQTKDSDGNIVIESFVGDITPSVAFDLTDEKLKQEGERQISTKRVESYVQDMDNKKWLLNGESLAFVMSPMSPLGWLRANGNHRLNAAAKSIFGFRTRIDFVALKEYVSVLDNPRVRTLKDQLNFSDYAKMSSGEIAVHKIGTIFISDGDYTKYVSLPQLLASLQNCPEAVNWAKQYVKHLKIIKAPALGALEFAYARADNDTRAKIDDFANELIAIHNGAVDISAGSPVFALNQFFTTGSISSAIDREKLVLATLLCLKEFILNRNINKLKDNMLKKSIVQWFDK